MASLVLAIAHDPGHRATLEPLAIAVESGDEWSVGDRHVVEARLTFPPNAVLPDGYSADINCRDDTPDTSWAAAPYTLFAATGPWDEAGAKASLDALTAWLRRVLPDAVRHQAGISANGVELVLQPDGDGWTVTERLAVDD
ncbi:MAG: hypothetical protein NZ518_02620 [Dehalococcoidia bacterium]|nr:hypothetical protein [Dehalococcoidia bacterium]